jgi:hypothetical protein
MAPERVWRPYGDDPLLAPEEALGTSRKTFLLLFLAHRVQRRAMGDPPKLWELDDMVSVLEPWKAQPRSDLWLIFRQKGASCWTTLTARSK